MASEKSLQDSFSDHSPRRHREDTTSSSSISSNDTKNTTKSNKCRRNSACTEYSEDFEDNSSIVESFKEGSVKSEHQAIKKESTTKNNNQSNQKRAQTKPTIKMLQHLNQSTVVKNKSQNRGGQDFDPVTRHILSARLHKTKELKNEVCDLQRELENARLENRLLRQLQYRHMKALVRFENEQNNLPQLLVRHEGEVQMLKEMLRKSKDQDRNVSKQLKEAESELWKTKNSLQKLKVLCDKKNLGERDELNWQLTNLTKKLELDQQKIQEKERQLGVKNIYANRVLLNHSKNMSSPRHKAENVAKAIQTEDCFSPISSFSPHNVLPNLEKKAVHCEKETSSEADDEDSKASKSQLRKEDGEMDSEVERLRKEYEQAEKRWKEMAENDILENLEREKREKQEKERADQFLREALERKETGEEEQDAKEREQQKTTEENRDASESRQDGNKEIGEAFALNDSPNKTPSRLRRRYRFTEQIENLHQGLPVCKISYAAHMSNKKRQDRQEDEFLDFNSSFNGYEPSFAKLCNRSTELMHQVGDGPSEKPKNCLQSTSRNDTKNSLMEKLFRSASTLENKPAKDDEVKAIDSLKQLQRNKQASRIQVTNKGRLNVLDPELLPVRVLESSADESEKLVLQSLNK
ncbi:lebercilin-like protein isoform X2 [Scyliorhinus canicula]|uniref:lebercilin-like protein isoform X2 n=1 Tax=Scyliorhinus canicula TaxID=7830 RepID=UPI0018F78F69|nr:lebercilin-like protein isoform X2 [Scyliorhinus canicula]